MSPSHFVARDFEMPEGGLRDQIVGRAAERDVREKLEHFK